MANSDDANNVFLLPSFLSIEYYDVVKDSLATCSNECVDAVEKSFQQAELLLNHRIGQLSFNKKFK